MAPKKAKEKENVCLNFVSFIVCKLNDLSFEEEEEKQ